MGKDEEANQREEETDFFHLESRDGYLQRIDQPFLPNIAYRLNENNDVIGYDVTFNQAYIFNRVSSGQVQVKEERKISNMDEAHELERDHDIRYYVQVEIDPENFKITDAQFTGYTPDCEEQTNFPHILFDQFDDDQQPFTGWFPVLRLEDGQVMDFTQRNNIFLSDRQFKQVGHSTTGDVGAAHILVESGRKEDHFPVRVRSISGAGTIEVTEFEDYILIDSSGSSGSGDWSGENIGGGAQVYNEYTLNPAEFRTLTGAENIVITQNATEIEIKSEDQICGSSSSDADWWAYVEDSKQPAKFRGLKAGSGITFEGDNCVTTINAETGCCTGEKKISVETIYNTYNSKTYITYSPTDTSTIEFYGKDKELLKLDGDSEVVTIGSDDSGECVTLKTYGDSELYDCVLGTLIVDWKKDSDGDGKSSTYDRDGNQSTELGSNSTKEGSIKTYNAAGTQIINETSSDGAGNAVSKQRNSANQVVNQTAASASTDTFFNAGGVAIGDNSTVAGKSLYVKGTTRIQDSSTAGDGTLEFGNDSTHSIGYTTSKNALTVGAGITSFDADHSNQIELFSTNSASYSSKDGYIIGSSPATGSAILAGSGNSISGHFNSIVAGANNTISGKSMNFIGGGSGIDITNSEFSVSVGGRNNDISGSSWSVLGGGYDNLISGGNVNNINGGYNNKIHNVFASVIAGGYDNLISGDMDSAVGIAGGVNNRISDSTYAFIGAGGSNIIEKDSIGAAIVGGVGNIASGSNSFIGGGRENVVSGNNGVALGSYGKVQEGHFGAFVFSDGNITSHFSSGANTMVMGFKSGVFIESDSGLYVNGNPVMTGASDLDTDTLQTVTDRGATTTNDITVADLLVQNNGQVRANGAGSLTLGNTNGGTIYVSGTSTKSIITPRVNHLYLQSNRDEDDIIFQAGEADVEMARFDSANQRFGIGIDNPNSRLHIGNATGSTLGLRFTNSTETVNQYFADDSTDSDFFITYAGNGGAEITLQHDGKLSLNNSNGDNVGVGTDDPRTSLHVSRAGTTEGAIITIDNPNNTDGSYCGIEFINSTVGYPRSAIFAQRTGAYDAELTFHTSETNQITGTDYPAATERMRIDHDGNVGIGTNSPNAELEIASSVATIRLTDSDLTNTFSEIEKGGDYLYFYSRANSSNGGFLFAGDNGTTETEFMRIATDGDVGIGSNIPSAKLDVAGGIKLLDNNYLTWNSSNTRIVGNSDYLQFQVAASDKVRIKSDGSVGIGTTDPAKKLSVYEAGNAQVQITGTNVAILTISDPNSHGQLNTYNDGTFRINSVANAAGTQLVLSGSKVGIGTASPTQLLDVFGSESKIALTSSAGRNTVLQQGGGHFHIRTSHTNGVAINHSESSAGKLAIYNGAGENIRFASDGDSFITGGNVGIGTTDPNYALTVNAGTTNQIARFISSDNDAVIGIQDSNDAVFIGYDAALDVMSLGFNSSMGVSSNVNIDTGGSVGIGTNAPAYPLDVVGTIHGTSGNFESGITIDGNPVVTGTSAFESDTLQTVTDQGNTTTNAVTISGAVTLFNHIFKGVENSYLGLFGGSDTLTNDGFIKIHGNSNNWGKVQTNIGYDATNSKAHWTLNDTTELMTLKGNGRLGIGTTDPNQLLHVDGKTQLGTNGFTEGGLIINYASLSETKGGASTLLGNAVYAGTTNNTFRRTKGDAGNYITLNYNKGITFHTNVTGNTSDDYDINNHEQMRITTGGFLGIGTTDPSQKLEVNGAIKSSQYLYLGSDVSLYRDGSNILRTDDALHANGGISVGGVAGGGFIYNRSETDSYIKFDDPNIVMMGGNVGIGSTSPQTILDVDGASNHGIRIGTNNALIGEGGSTGTQLIFWNGDSAFYGRSAVPFNHSVSNHFFRVGGNDIAMIGSAGVGIGTTSPAHQLHLNKENAIAEMQISRDGSDPSTDTDIGRIQFKTDYSSSPNEVGSIWVRTNSSAYRTDMRFGVKATAGSEEVGLTIHGTNDGPFVGVGTTNPTQTFHVKAEQDGDYVARITNTEATTGANYGLKVDGGSNASDVTFEASSLAGTSYFQVQGDGNVGIGSTSPDAHLNVYNTGTTSSVADVHIVGSGNTYGLLVERLRNDSLIVSKSTTAGSYFKTDSATASFQGYEIGTNWFLGQYGYNDFRITDGSKSGGTAALTIQDSTQNVGIGTTNPADTLQVAGQVRIDGATGDGLTITSSAGASRGLEIYNNSSTDTASIINYYNGPLVLGQNNSEVMRLDNACVGIGSSNPAGDKLTVQADNNYFAARLNGSTTAGQSYGLRVRAGYNSTDRPVLIEKGDGSDIFIIDGLGNVGIGSAPSYELDVSGTTRSTYYIGGAYLEENASSSKLKFYTDGTVLVIDEDGELKPCEKENDTLVFGVSKKDFDSPVVLGAEPVLVTGPIKVGDYIVTSSKQGHGQAMKEQKLGTIIAQAMESGDGESYNIKAMIRKM